MAMFSTHYNFDSKEVNVCVCFVFESIEKNDYWLMIDPIVEAFGDDDSVANVPLAYTRSYSTLMAQIPENDRNRCDVRENAVFVNMSGLRHLLRNSSSKIAADRFINWFTTQYVCYMAIDCACWRHATLMLRTAMPEETRRSIKNDNVEGVCE